MSNRDISPYDWFKRFFGSESGRDFFSSRDVFREFDEMQREMQRMYNQFTEIQSNAPKELIREYETKEGNKVREVGPIVYGYSMTIGPDGKPHVQEFGNIKAGKNISGHNLDIQKPYVTAERDPISDVTSTDKEIKIVVEIPG